MKGLPSSTSDNIEMRLCADGLTRYDEDTSITLRALNFMCSSFVVLQEHFSGCYNGGYCTLMIKARLSTFKPLI